MTAGLTVAGTADRAAELAPGFGRLANMVEPGRLEYVDYPLPEPGPGALLVRVLRANVCGSDLHTWRGKHPVKKSGGLGHEMLGEVLAIGAGRPTDNRGEPLVVGARVAYTYFQTCRRCAQCLRGQLNLCDNAYEHFGKQPDEAPHFHAAFGTHCVVQPDQHVYVVPEALPDVSAAGANCGLSQVLFGIDQVGIAYGETVLVQGAGGLGLSAIAVAKERGAARVVVVDGVDARLEQATRFGADAVIRLQDHDGIEALTEAVRAAFGGAQPDVAIEVAGVPAAFADGLQLVRRGGRYLVMGNLSPGTTVPYDPGLITRKALTVRHVDRYDGRYLWQALRFLTDHRDRYPFDTLVDAEFPFERIEEALVASAERRVTRAAIVMG
ncbi:zinc-binding dehydrogenase [Agrococcus sp. ARC_14]|uniref:zinc-binding dehydrogenase n=1 Tax=Agrococcus sp. ARC_14 TaxID=2919927 RepID=UPI001F0562E8|nr:zinc-binding dehydrogenase [Agrococcus sp. ARC_14]MCH1881360.1 zinc-binding dehydrogenase [Agrococcus sp. ARC_14]